MIGLGRRCLASLTQTKVKISQPVRLGFPEGIGDWYSLVSSSAHLSSRCNIQVAMGHPMELPGMGNSHSAEPETTNLSEEVCANGSGASPALLQPNEANNPAPHKRARHSDHPTSLNPDTSAEQDSASPSSVPMPEPSSLLAATTELAQVAGQLAETAASGSEPAVAPAPEVGSQAPLLAVSRPIGNARIDAAWEYFQKLGSPKYHVAPMVDQSELPFRMLCRKYGATAAYTPMLHSRIFAQEPKYRKEFTTCPEDRPLFVQFCANDPDRLLEAAKIVAPITDYVDINLGCPQRIARRGNYGAFLMDDLPLVQSLVAKLSANLSVPVSCKIRIFPNLDQTLAYARMLEEAGCSLLAVHGRTRDQKDQKAIRADWNVIRAVKQAVRIPVLANGNVRWLEDADECMRVTGAQGVMSADALLENPALFAGHRMPGNDGDTSQEGSQKREQSEGFGEGAVAGGELRQSRESQQGGPDHVSLLLEYLDLCDKYPVPMRMVRAHVHKLVGPWFRVHTDIRERLNKENKITVSWIKELVQEMAERNQADLSLKPLYKAPEKMLEVSRNEVTPAGSTAAVTDSTADDPDSTGRHCDRGSKLAKPGVPVLQTVAAE